MLVLGIHLVLLGMALLGRRFSSFSLARLRDLIVLQALWLSFWAPGGEPPWWVLAQAPVLVLLVRHARAHILMKADLANQFQDRLEAVEADERSGILDADEAARKAEQVRRSNASALALTDLGQQMAWLGCFELGLLLFAHGAIGGSWLFWVSLPTLALSKLQDLMLSDHVPHRLC